MSVRRIRNGSARPPGAGLTTPGLVVPRGGLSRRKVLGRAAGAGLLVTPAASLLAACATGGGDDSDDGPDANAENPFGFAPDSRIDAVFFTGGFGTEYPNALAEEFAKHWPDAQVGVATTETIRTEMQPRFAGGNPPDFLNNSGDEELALDGLVNDGAVHPLTELMDAPSLDDPNTPIRDTVVVGVEEFGSFGGTMYSLNLVNSSYGMWYDAKLFRDNGWAPPTNWSEFLALAAQMQAAGIAPFINGNATGLWYLQNVLMEWVNLEGGHEVTVAIDNLEPGAWQQAAVVTAASRLQELVDNGLVYPGMEGLTHIQAQQTWLDREAGFLWCGTWLEAEMSDEAVLEEHEVGDGGIPADFEMTMMAPWAPSDQPVLAAGSVRNQPGEPFVIPTAAANRAGGLELMRVMLTKDFADRFTELTNTATVVKGTGQNVQSVAFQSAAAVTSAAPDNLLWRWEGWYNQKMYADTMEPLIGELMAGRASAQDLLDAMEDAAAEVRDDPDIEKFTREI
ncbi:MAG: carbohydrate ABC transporter, N-acetylglucosamine/diacetylchitobiose-binding protein [Micromonosporaceae bacterium]|nr:carbohydrate ABC transporter, N-acetylglucosamine/diacetylchitobiose-binding protein [Micromonosporaceae bacterium]